MRAIFNSRHEKIEKSNAKVVLFFLSRDGECDDKTKALALGILGKFLQCTSPVVSVVSFNGCVCLPFEAYCILSQCGNMFYLGDSDFCVIDNSTVSITD